jgi:hypothetical protein
MLRLALGQSNQWKILSFATALRDEVSQTHGIPKESLATVPEKYQYRDLMQTVGQAKRAEDPDYWVNKFHEKYFFAELDNPFMDIFVDDARMDNEARYLTKLGFVFIKCEPHVTQVIDAMGTGNNQHESERDYKLWIPDYRSQWEATPERRAMKVLNWLESSGIIEEGLQEQSWMSNKASLDKILEETNRRS